MKFYVCVYICLAEWHFYRLNITIQSDCNAIAACNLFEKKNQSKYVHTTNNNNNNNNPKSLITNGPIVYFQAAKNSFIHIHSVDISIYILYHIAMGFIGGTLDIYRYMESH